MTFGTYRNWFSVVGTTEISISRGDTVYFRRRLKKKTIAFFGLFCKKVFSVLGGMGNFFLFFFSEAQW